MTIPRTWPGAVTAALLALALSGASAAAPTGVGGATLTAVPFEALPGFPGPDAEAALDAFRRVCAAPTPALPQPPSVAGDLAALSNACTAAKGDAPEAAAFFRDHFDAFRIERPEAGQAGFLTGYFEDRKSTRLNSSHSGESRMPSSA